MGIVFDVVHPGTAIRTGSAESRVGPEVTGRDPQEACGVEHADDFLDNVEVVLGDVHPDIERGGEGGAELFSRDRREVGVRFDEDL